MELTAAQGHEVRALAVRAAAADGVEPLNEEAHLALTGAAAQHLIALVDDRIVGYLQWQPTYRSAQLVVDPARRRHGIGRSLVADLQRMLLAPGSPWGLWAFGDLTPAQGFASALGLVPERGLLVMSRPLTGLDPAEPPSGLTVRTYEDSDAESLLAVNAAAFADHPEQGKLDLVGLAARTEQDWFDPQGLILGFDDSGLVGFHWTKVADGIGEVYVIAVAPRAQGRGYGRALLEAGMSHLATKGLPAVLLYVDDADQNAVRMYERAGFSVDSRDVFYASRK